MFYRSKKSPSGYKPRCKKCQDNDKRDYLRRKREELGDLKKKDTSSSLKSLALSLKVKRYAQKMMAHYLTFYEARKKYISILAKHYKVNVFPSIDILTDYTADCMATDAEIDIDVELANTERGDIGTLAALSSAHRNRQENQ